MSNLFRQTDFLYATISANKTANLAQTNHVEFDLFYRRGTSISCATTGSGQQLGIFTLAPNRIYQVSTQLLLGVNEGQSHWIWSHAADNSYVFDVANNWSNQMYFIDNYSTDTADASTDFSIFAPSEEISIILYHYGGAGGAVSPLYEAGCHVLIEEL